MSETPLKQCKNEAGCVHPDAVDGWLPATTDYFYFRKDNGKFRAECKACFTESTKQYAQNNRERVAERKRDYAARNAERLKASKREYRQKNAERIRAQKRDYYRANAVEIKQRAREWRLLHPEWIEQYRQQYRAQNADKLRSKRRAYYLNNKDRELSKSRAYHKANSDAIRDLTQRWKAGNLARVKANHHRRQAKKKGLPASFTSEQWQRALDYFNGCCAVCGRQLRDLFATHTAAADHWIPLASPECPGTIAENILPLCHGENGCNNSKGSKSPRQWLVGRFGKRRAAQIFARVEAYFEWVRRQDEG